MGQAGEQHSPPGADPITLTRIASPPPRLPQPPLPSSLAAGGGRQEQREAHPTEEEQGGVTLQPCCGLRQP